MRVSGRPGYREPSSWAGGRTNDEGFGQFALPETLIVGRRPARGLAQKAASSSSMIEASMFSAMARSPAISGRMLRAKNEAAATLPS